MNEVHNQIIFEDSEQNYESNLSTSKEQIDSLLPEGRPHGYSGDIVDLILNKASPSKLNFDDKETAKLNQSSKAYHYMLSQDGEQESYRGSPSKPMPRRQHATVTEKKLARNIRSQFSKFD